MLNTAYSKLLEGEEMKKLYKTLLAASAFALLPSLASAGSSTGLVSKIYVHSPNEDYSDIGAGVMMFKVGNISSRPGCAKMNEWSIGLNTHLGRTMHKTLLAAMVANKTVEVHGTGYCEDWKDREKPYYIVVK